MWSYSQTSGNIFAPNGLLAGTGYSGRGPGLNNTEMQAVEGVGPIPQGLYAIGAFFDDPQKGPIVAHLIPDPANEMYGRSGFMIHGSRIGETTRSSSDGCIVQAHAIRAQIAASGDRALLVTA